MTKPRLLRSFLPWLGLLAAFAGLHPALAGPLLVADEWCPYNCAQDDVHQGYVIDLLQAIFTQAGMPATYLVTPWTRAILMVEQGKADLLVGTTPEVTPHHLLSLPIGENRTCFFAALGSPWHFQQIADLYGQRLGVIQGYSYDAGGALDRYIASNPSARGKVLRATGAQALQKNLRMLAAGRLDVVAENCNVGTYRLQKLGLAGSIQLAGQLGSFNGTVHIGFKPNTPNAQQWLTLINQGLNEKRRSGELERLLQTYGLHDWAPQP